MRPPVKSPHRLGFTIIELVVAVLVLTVGILAFAALAQRLAADVRASHLTVRLDVRARSLVDSLRALGYDLLLPGAPPAGTAALLVTEDSSGLKEIVVVVADSVAGNAAADTLATRVFHR